MQANSELLSGRQTGAIDNRVLSVIAALVVIAAVLIYLSLRPPAPDAPVAPVTPPPPPATPEERGDSARELIAELREAGADADFGRALERAREFRAAGRLADAQLLYFFAARGGHGPAALELAAMYDPLHHSAESSLMDEPDPFQAYKWYRQALETGEASAGERLAALKGWAEQRAGAGDEDAERLLLQWQ